MFPEAWSLVKAHQRMGHTVAIATSATRYQAVPIAEELGIAHVLSTRATVRDGRLTGAVEGTPLWGSGKAAGVRDFAKAHGIALAASYGYANGNEDIAFLKTVGHATAVNPKPALIAAAARAGWNVLRFPKRRNTATTLARSAGAYLTLAATSLGGVAYAATTGERRRAAEWVSARGSDAMLAMTGVDVEVQGEQHLWAHRPSVFMFNHQSMADGYVLLRLLRRGFTGVAKQEASHMPLLGQILRALDFAFIDRSATRSAIEAMAAGGRSAPAGDERGDRARGHAQPHAAARPLQEGRLSHRDAGGCARSACGFSQHPRGDAARLPAVSPRHRRCMRAAADRRHNLEARRPRPPHRRRARAVPAHARRLAAQVSESYHQGAE